jgi:hypothetical protein
MPTQQPDDSLLAAMENLGMDAETARATLQGDAESLAAAYKAILDAILGQNRCAAHLRCSNAS